MRKYFFLSIVLFSFIGCSKDIPDDADAFIGGYEISITETSVWGSSAPYTTTTPGRIFISKEGPNRILMSGSFRTYGNVSGNTVLFETTSSSSNLGHLTTHYNTGILAGENISFSMTLSGELLYEANNRLYPYSAVISVTGVKNKSINY